MNQDDPNALDDTVVPNRTFYFESSENAYSLIEDEGRPELGIFPSLFMIAGWPEIEGQYGTTLSTTLATSMFAPIMESYEDNGQSAKLDYVHVPSKKYGLRIIYHRTGDVWFADKYIIGEERSSRYNAPTLDALIRHIMLSGYK